MIKSGLYVHIPFCNRRCGYCDFNTFAGQSHLIPQYVSALCQELAWVRKRYATQTSIDSIFFGGGTPTMLEPSQFEVILRQLRQTFEVDDDCEVTIEANPGTVSAKSLKDLKAMGFTRVSFGMQSAHSQDLKVLDRRHQYVDVVNAVAWSRQVGFEHINLDLIFGIPGQTLEHWKTNLYLVTQLPVDHLSLYSLILEEGTPLDRWYKRGLVDWIDDDLTADMYETAMDILAERGFVQYEISNWAKVRPDGLDARCRHNLNTWRYQPYFGMGAGAHGFVENIRTQNVSQIHTYLDRISKSVGDWPAADTVDHLSVWDEMQEWMMVGLRKVEEGVVKNDFESRFGQSISTVFAPQIERLEKQGLLEDRGESIRLSKRGIMLGNRVFTEFVGNEKPTFLD